MHPESVVRQALAMRAAGRDLTEISGATGVPRGTIRDWARGKVPRRSGRFYRDPADPGCSRCGGPSHVWPLLGSYYVLLLGLYLGDGCISEHRRSVFRLRISLDCKHPGIADECARAMRLIGTGKVLRQTRSCNCFEVSSYSKAWRCLFPQHGPGKKHERAIKLTDWQEYLVDRWPQLLLRGLIFSDGCRFINTGRGGWRYPRYSFSNKSEDILEIFQSASDTLGLQTTRAPRTIYISRRRDVDLLDRWVGPKDDLGQLVGT